jgi:hypothetical protein
LICLVIDQTSGQWLGYEFGYDILLLNSLLTFVALVIFSRNPGTNEDPIKRKLPA